MIDIPLSLRVPPQGRYNRGIYTCYECGFEPPHYNVVPCMLGLAETSAGTMVVWECPRCTAFHSRKNFSARLLRVLHAGFICGICPCCRLTTPDSTAVCAPRTLPGFCRRIPRDPSP